MVRTLWPRGGPSVNSSRAAWKWRRLHARRRPSKSYVASLRAVCGWAVNRDILESNPASNIKITVPTKPKTRPKSNRPDEARRILAAALSPQPDTVTASYRAARRWIPWLCAYTGARVGEIAQLRKQDVRQENGVWLLQITPEAGTVKDGNTRDVALHPEPVRQDFPAFVRRAKDGPLFYEPARRRNGSKENALFRKVGEHLAKWIRDDVGIDDPVIRPNHAWRHWFKTAARKSGLDPAARDYMMGHAPATVGEEYGDWEPEALNLEISKMPVIDPAEAGIRPESGATQ